MKPQEKAQELIGRFKQNQILAISNTRGNMVYPYVSGVIGNKVMEHQAKQYALICVQEIIYAIAYGIEYEWIQFRNKQTDYIVYWNQVKQEIEKL